MSVSYLCSSSKLETRLQTGVIVQINFFIQSFHLFLPLSSQSDLFRVPVRDIKLLGVLCVLWALISCLFFLPVTIPVFLSMFLFILVNGAMWSPCALFYNLFGHNHCMGCHCYLGWCFCFYSGCRCRGNWPIFPCFELVLGG